MSQLAVRLQPVTSLTLLPVLVAVVLLFAVAFDQVWVAPVVKAASGELAGHESFHDSRHMLSFPCH